MKDQLTPYQKKILKRMAKGEEPDTIALGPWTRAYRFGNEKQGLNSQSLWKMQKAGLIEKKSKLMNYGVREWYVITTKGKKCLKG